MYNSRGVRIWKVIRDIYGRERHKIGGETYETDCQIRFQGQYEDYETGFYYNRFRYYMPEESMYSQRDPIGIAGGNPSLYGYVWDSTGQVDIFGLAKECPTQVIGDFVEIDVKYVDGMPINEFRKKANALKELGDNGQLYKAANPVARNSSIPKAYRQDMIDRIWAQYGDNNREFANSLIDRITDPKRMQVDHVWELQLGGPDITSNLRFLDSFTNGEIGMRQIWPQIKNLPTGTKIKINIIE